MKLHEREKEPLEGFPLPPRERAALDVFDDAPSPRPKGVAGVTLTNLKKKRWIEQAGRSENPHDYGEPLYSTTELGKLAIEIDTYFANAGWKRQGIRAIPPAASTFDNLAGKWARYRNSK